MPASTPPSVRTATRMTRTAPRMATLPMSFAAPIKPLRLVSAGALVSWPNGSPPLSGPSHCCRLFKLQDSQSHFCDEFRAGDDVLRERLDFRSQSFELRVESRELLDLHKLTFLREPVLS